MNIVFPETMECSTKSAKYVNTSMYCFYIYFLNRVRQVYSEEGEKQKLFSKIFLKYVILLQGNNLFQKAFTKNVYIFNLLNFVP